MPVFYVAAALLVAEMVAAAVALLGQAANFGQKASSTVSFLCTRQSRRAVQLCSETLMAGVGTTTGTSLAAAQTLHQDRQQSRLMISKQSLQHVQQSL
jgi:hypothetical protein